ncbi:hypothetical protein GCM10011378_28990 [Hymenobacter glacieicola]|uniref:Uncharacterized protein n=1 Tax=Hymenobacter glacieicola TaxID=1562124 RepID=A0ABQ1WYH6_9BACT|nr:hypothetical protein GCM10011378_28990 [Hymenobacter glacieicola]
MESSQADNTNKKVRSMRLPDQGNPLWIAYQKLSRLQQRAFKDAVQECGFTFNTFLHDTALERPLDLIPFGRLDFYSTFFKAVESEQDFFTVARLERRKVLLHRSL